MARGFSKAIIMGNLTRDPEMRTTPGGANVASFSIAVNRVFRDASGQNQEHVSFINCAAWGKTAETISQYAKKGSGLLVSGRIEQRSWDDKATGQKRSAVEIVVEDFTFLPRSGEGGGGYGNGGGENNATASTMAAVPADVVPTDEDIPDDDKIDLSEIPF